MTDQLNQFDSENSCPKCGSPFVEKVRYTWWGGVLGPKMLHHTKCAECKYTFNSKTRRSNTNGIIIYSVIIFAIAFTVFFVLRSK